MSSKILRLLPARPHFLRFVKRRTSASLVNTSLVRKRLRIGLFFFFFLSRFIRSVAARPDVISSSRYAVRRASVQNQTSAHVDAGRLTPFKGRRSEHAGNLRSGVNKSMCAHLAGKQTNARGARGADELLRRIDYFQKSHHAIVAVSIFRATLAVGSV